MTRGWAAALAIGMVAMLAVAQNAPQTPKIRVATRLVQVDVIVRDKNGPVENLTKDDFTVLDQGKTQGISLFSVKTAAAPEVAVPAASLPPDTFTDMPQYGATAPRSVTIVLLDNLNTLYGSTPDAYESTPYWFEDLALENAKAHLMEFIKQLSANDRVAIYGLSDSLHVLCDFTNDHSELLAILKKYDTSAKTNREIVEPGGAHTPGGGYAAPFNAMINRGNLANAAIANQRRAEVTMVALQAIASHVASIPGRKNLVWLTANLPFSANAMARVLGPSEIAVYPMDGRGLLPRTAMGGLEGWENEDNYALGMNMPADSPQPIGIDTMQKLADETGGEAFVNTNDLTGAIRKAIDDSGVTYTLGFYVDGAALDGKFHELKVEVNRSGLTLRYPKGYFATPDAPATKDQNWSSVVTAVQSPIESSAIPVEVRVERVNQPSPNSLGILGVIDIHTLRLEQEGNERKGAVVIYLVEQDQAGKVLRESTNKISLQVTEKQYADYLKSGVFFRQYLRPESGDATLRVLVEDPATSEVGSLIIPLWQVN